LGQVYAELYPEKLKGFISIDSAPLQRKYLGGFYLWILKRTVPIYRSFPWKLLVKMCARGAAESEYGRRYMRETLMSLDGGKRRYAKLAGYGYKILAEAYEKELPYEIKCPALLICGKKDRVGFCARFNKEWHKNSGILLEWVKGAGHNSNTDQPEVVNRLIEEFVEKRLDK
jgi:pimeloyl-ACP methyl ester carboxylesterase